MKSLKFSLLAVAGALMLSFGASAQTAAKKATPAPAPSEVKPVATKASEISWAKDVHDFGTIEKGKPVSYDFTFKNTTKQTILITNVKASCGCTATNYTKTPIKPGETGSVTATYNAASPGSFTKTVTVTTNDSEVNKILTIKGVVKDDAAAPATKS
ncbi:DUF1573 domain-containing protein [Flavobacterium sp. J372]|uniref:DUF1573 domain-containing protein n=1 Tax=Flavobacterium sp. J372 TaxID=2898436 RepID=UPI002151B801|nr:DUF1573 domain-containing protein [Flavobacterium sp. J372]MCR5860951.1 DUF1573 domain-containing protein [Flavobacterium sp. J372]